MGGLLPAKIGGGGWKLANIITHADAGLNGGQLAHIYRTSL